MKYQIMLQNELPHGKTNNLHVRNLSSENKGADQLHLVAQMLRCKLYDNVDYVPSRFPFPTTHPGLNCLMLKREIFKISV